MPIVFVMQGKCLFSDISSPGDVEKSFAVTKSNTERDFFSFMSKRRKFADVLPVLAQNKSILHMACA